MPEPNSVRISSAAVSKPISSSRSSRGAPRGTTGCGRTRGRPRRRRRTETRRTGQSRTGTGRVASDGSVWYNDDLIDRLGVDDETLEAIRTREAAAAADKLETYRDESGGPTLEGQRVLVVDDGVATGATARACLEQARNADAAAVSLAVPVGPPQAIADLEALADAVYALREPADFRAVGQWYREFGQVSDETAMEYLS